MLQIFRSVVDDPVARAAPAPADIIDRPSSIVAPIRNPPSRLERVGLVAELDVAARPRARVWVASQVNPAWPPRNALAWFIWRRSIPPPRRETPRRDADR